jgi:hypothetical protein
MFNTATTSHRGAFFDPVHQKRTVSLTRPCLSLGLGRSLLAECDDRVNPGSSQGWDQACEYGNHR